METKPTMPTYPPRFFPVGMPVETPDGITRITNLSHIRYIYHTDNDNSYTITELTPKPDGIFGFTPDMLAAILDGRKTQTTVPIRKLMFKVGDIVRVGEKWAPLDLIWEKAAIFQDGCAIETNFTILPPINTEFVRRWQKPETMPLWATRYFLRITAVETMAPCKFDTNKCFAEGIKGVLNMSFQNYNPNVFNIGETDGIKFFFDDKSNYKTAEEAWYVLWLLLNPKNGELTFEKEHTVYTFELCK